MAESGENDAPTLKGLRDRIDATDAKLHQLLIERGTVIDALIRTKGTSRAGAAFRPMREADMMRRIVARHSGALPLATVEHIWREIITTFTHMQAPFDVAIDTSVEPDRIRDLARFVFGFSVDLIALDDAEAVIGNVAANGNLGIVARKARGAWWRGLVPQKARIMALVPFIENAGSPANLPAFVISPPLTDETPPDFTVFAASVAGPFHRPADVETLASTVQEGVTEVLLAAPAGVTIAERLNAAGVQVTSVTEVGGFARGIAVGGGSTALYAAGPAAGEGT
jgi:chorismate mutase/prephenate dehydratase